MSLDGLDGVVHHEWAQEFLRKLYLKMLGKSLGEEFVAMLSRGGPDRRHTQNLLERAPFPYSNVL